MAITFPSWITIDRAVGDLTPFIPELQVYTEFAKHWRAIAAQLWKLGADAPVDSPVALATYVASRLEDPSVAEVFATLGLDGLRGQLATIGHGFTDPDAPWAKLLQPSNAFLESYGPQAGNGLFEDGDNPGLIRLAIPTLAEDGVAPVAKGSMTFGISAAGGLECEAGSVWPFRGDGVVPGLLRIGADGMVKAKAGVSLPFGTIGSGTAETAASVDARFDVFFRPASPASAFAEILFPALTSIPDPIDLSQINHAVELAGLEGIVLACGGAASAGLAATLGVGSAIADFASITAGLVADLQFKRNARWLLSLRKTAEGLHFVLSRAMSRERNWSVGVDIGVDYSGLARRVHDTLVRVDGLAEPILAQIRPFLSPGTYIAEHAGGLLNAAVASIVDEPELKAAFAQDIGLVLGTSLGTDAALANYVRGRIADLAADHAGGILADADAWSRAIGDGFAAAFPALGAPDLADRLVARIRPMLSDIGLQFETALDGLVHQEGLAAALKAAGVELSSAEADADELLAGLRSLVEKFDGFARTVIAKTGEGIDHKLQARFGWTGGSTSGVHYELIGTFAHAGPELASLWRALVTGRLEPFQRILADPSVAPAGLRVDPASSLSRFAGRHHGFALEVVVLDLTVSIRSIVTGKAQITLSANGDIAVSAEGSATRTVEGFDEGRGASFVSAWDLALHKADGPQGGQRKMSVAVAFDHDDKKLGADEVSGFLGGLAAQGLVESARVQRALEVYQEWRTATLPGQAVRGRIDVHMALTGAAVTRMVALGRAGGVKGSTAQLQIFTCAARALLAAGVTDNKRIDRDCREARREFAQLAAVDDPWRIMYGLQDVDLTPPQTGGQRGYVYSAFGQIIPRAIGFPRLLATMAQIYDAIPMGAHLAGPQWTERDYARAEETMAAEARLWLRLNQKFVFWFKEGLHPVLLAFLRLLADMNRPLLGEGDPFKELDQHVDTAASSPLFTITLAQPGGRATAV